MYDNIKMQHVAQIMKKMTYKVSINLRCGAGKEAIITETIPSFCSTLHYQVLQQFKMHIDINDNFLGC
jgi:hypothetical protein